MNQKASFKLRSIVWLVYCFKFDLRCFLILRWLDSLSIFLKEILGFTHLGHEQKLASAKTKNLRFDGNSMRYHVLRDC